MRLLITGILSFCFSIQPSILMAAQSRSQADLTRAFLRDTQIGQRDVSLKELYEKQKNVTSAPSTYWIEGLLKSDPDFKIPKPTILRTQDAKGKETIQLSFQVNGQNLLLTFLGEPDRFVKINNRFFTLQEANNANYMAMELQSELRAPAGFKQLLGSQQANPKAVFLSVSQIQKMNPQNQARYLRNVFGMMEALEEFQNKIGQYQAGSKKTAKSKLQILIDLGLLSEAVASNSFVRDGAQCFVAGWAGQFASSTNGADCEGGKAPCTFCKAPTEAKGTCPNRQVTCNPALYGDDAGKDCFLGQKNGATTLVCNQRYIQSPDFYKKLIDRMNKDPQKIRGEIEKINQQFASAHNYCGSLLKDESYKIGGQAIAGGAKAALLQDQKETCAQLGLRIKSFNDTSCSFELETFDNDYARSGITKALKPIQLSEACKQVSNPPAPPVPEQPPVCLPDTPPPAPSPTPAPPCQAPPTVPPPVPANPPGSGAVQCDSAWVDKVLSGEGMSCSPKKCQAGEEPKEMFECSCGPGYAPALKAGKVDSCYKSDPSKIAGSDRPEREGPGFFKRNKDWMIPVGIVMLTGLVGWFALSSYKDNIDKQMCTIYNVCDSQKDPVTVTPVTTPTTQPASMPTPGTK